MLRPEASGCLEIKLYFPIIMLRGLAPKLLTLKE